ncbi:MAG: type II toxin-antitoxin system HicA family toxin [Eubacterium sp.]|nr:type II toxin-antitoxin system HicA family toxin [Eubacterium sp.]
MDKLNKLYNEIIINNKTNISFADILYFLEHLGFSQRVRGDHYIFRMDDIKEIINIQPDGKMCKPYQVRQIRNIVKKYKLGRDDNE